MSEMTSLEIDHILSTYFHTLGNSEKPNFSIIFQCKPSKINNLYWRLISHVKTTNQRLSCNSIIDTLLDHLGKIASHISPDKVIRKIQSNLPQFVFLSNLNHFNLTCISQKASDLHIPLPSIFKNRKKCAPQLLLLQWFFPLFLWKKMGSARLIMT